MADLRLIIHIGAVLLLAECLFLFGISGVIAVKEHASAVFQFQDLSHGPVEKIAVMRHDQNSAPIVHQIGLKPSDAAHIKVVCRLIQHKDVRLLQKQFAQRHTRFLSA